MICFLLYSVLTSVHSWAIVGTLPDWSVIMTWCRSIDQKKISDKNNFSFTAWRETISQNKYHGARGIVLFDLPLLNQLMVILHFQVQCIQIINKLSPYLTVPKFGAINIHWNQQNDLSRLFLSFFFVKVVSHYENGKFEAVLNASCLITI